MPPSFTSRMGHTATAVGNDIFVIGGIGDGNSYILHVDRLLVSPGVRSGPPVPAQQWTVECDTLSSGSNCPVGLYGHTATRIKEGILVFGGWPIPSSVLLTITSFLPYPLSEESSFLTLYLTLHTLTHTPSCLTHSTDSGTGPQGLTNQLLLFNPSTLLWTTITSTIGRTPTPRCGHTAVALGGGVGDSKVGSHVVVFGGFSESIGYSSGER